MPHFDIYFVLLLCAGLCASSLVDPRWVVDTSSSSGSSCTSNCYISRTRLCGNVACNQGIITENVVNCPLPDLCPDSQLTLYRNLSECSGRCYRATEQVEFRCKNGGKCKVYQNRFCADESSCTGYWSGWSEYGQCNATCGGFRQRQRRCYDSTGARITYCKGGQNEHVQTDTSSCKPCQTSTLNPKIATSSRCEGLCENISHFINNKTLFHKCDGVMPTSGIFPKDSCKTNRQFLLSCEGSFESRLCAPAESSLYCAAFLTWSAWSNWEKGKYREKEHRNRYQSCSESFHKSSPSISCHRAVRVEDECRREDSPSSGSRLHMWTIIVLVVLVIIIIILIMCLCRKRKNKRRNNNGRAARKLTGVEKMSKELPNNVFHDDPPCPTDGAIAHNRSPNGVEQESNRLTVLQRFTRASDHLYESISGRARLFSRPSAAVEDDEHNSPNHRSTDKILVENVTKPNEYILTEDEIEEAERAKPTVRRSKPCNPKHPLRISVTITDPEGIQVEKSVYKPKLRPQKETLKTLQRKTRWSRLPTPQPSTSAKKFFAEDKSKHTSNDRVYVPSVKYGTGSSEVNDKTEKQPSPKNDKLGLRKMLMRLRKPDPNKKTSHQYDAVAKEEVPGVAKAAYISSTPDGMADDDVSIWSDSTFDGMDDSGDELPITPNDIDDMNEASPRVYTRKYRRKKERPTLKNVEGISTQAMCSLPPEFLTPNTDVRSPMRHRWSDQSAQDGRFQFSKNKLNTNSAATSDKPACYVDMTVHENGGADTLKRKDVRSWVKLGAPPVPATRTTVKVAGSSTGSPQREVDAKYVTPNSVRRSPTSENNERCPVDSLGYLHLD